MKKRFKMLHLLALLISLSGCNNQKQYDYSQYYKYTSTSGKGIFTIYCWKEFFDWNTFLDVGTSSGLCFKERINQLQNDLPCPIDTMKEILATDDKIDKIHFYAVCVVQKPVKDDGMMQSFKGKESEKYKFLNDRLGLKNNPVFYLE